MASKRFVDLGAVALAVAIREAAGDLSSSDVTNRLRDTIADHFRGTNEWGYFCDYIGDASSGDVIYSCGGDTCKAPYEIADAGGSARCVIDFEQAVDVVPRTIYEEEMD